jgi:peptidylprolyl isomerase
MWRGWITGTVLLAMLTGCVEILDLMTPDSDSDARFRYDFDDIDTNDDLNTNGDGSTDAPEMDMDAQVEEINAGNVGDIPAIPSTVQQVTTSSGLRYFDVTPGGGDIPRQDSTVTVNYTGWLAEGGTEFDSSELAQFNLQSVIAGWTEGLSTMQVGGTRRLIIPPELGYGAQGAPPSIPANAWLVFDVDLVAFE